MDERYTLGIDVGGTKIACALFTGNRELVAKNRVPTPPETSPLAFLYALYDQAEALLRDNGLTFTQIAGVGIGLPCFIRQPDGFVLTSSNIPCLANFAAGDALRKVFSGVRVEIDNDAHAGALAESRHGAGRGFESMLYCAVSTGISSAPVIEGRLFRGSYGFSGESGHMLVTPDAGIRCDCGKRGCFMSWCSGMMIARHVRGWIASGERSIVADLAGGLDGISTVEIQKAFDMGDALASRAVDQMQRYLSLWLYNLYLIFNINCFVLGGGLLKMGDAFWENVFDRFHVLNANDCPVHFRKAELGDDFGVIGANELLYQEAGV